MIIILLAFLTTYTYAAREGLEFSTKLAVQYTDDGVPLDLRDSNTLRPDFRPGNILWWNYNLKYNGNQPFSTNACFFLQDPNYHISDITKTIERRANEKYCNAGNPNCPIRLDNVRIAEGTNGNIVTYTIPDSGIMGRYQLIVQLRRQDVPCSNKINANEAQDKIIAESINYLNFKEAEKKNSILKINDFCTIGAKANSCSIEIRYQTDYSFAGIRIVNKKNNLNIRACINPSRSGTYGGLFYCVEKLNKGNYLVELRKEGNDANSELLDAKTVVVTDVFEENIGPQPTLVILTGINSQPPSIDINTAKEIVFGNNFGSANDYYAKNSYGKISFNGRIIGPYNIESNVCNFDEVRDEILKIVDPEVNFNDYKRIIIFQPSTDCRPTAYGVGTVGRTSFFSPSDGIIRASITQIFKPNYLLSSLTHEVGHNLGFEHSSSLLCLGDCKKEEYGDYFDIMGNKIELEDGTFIVSPLLEAPHMNAKYKESTGWLKEPENIVTTTKGRYEIRPLELEYPNGFIQLIKLPLDLESSSNTYRHSFYTLEFRQPINYDAGAANEQYNGIIIHSVEEPRTPAISKTSLIRHPELSPLGFTHLLRVGTTYKDNIHKKYEIKLERIEEDSNGKKAIVNIDELKREIKPNNNPTGVLEEVKITPDVKKDWSRVYIDGWAIDPDTENYPTFVEVLIDGRSTNSESFQPILRKKIMANKKDENPTNAGPQRDHRFKYDFKVYNPNTKEIRVHVSAIDTSEYNTFELQSSPKTIIIPTSLTLTTLPPTGAAVINSDLESKNKEDISLEGELEVDHIDFENPEDSKYLFYLISEDNTRYELIYNKELPVVMSGTQAIVKGKIQNNKILLENLIIKESGFDLTKFASPLEHDVLLNETLSKKKIPEKAPLEIKSIVLIITIIFVFILILSYIWYKKKN